LRKPNFFLLGAAKCGTTSLQSYLAGHPRIFMSVPKEPCYFSKDLRYPASPRNDDEYLRCFAGANDDHVIVGEASVDYLYSRVAVANILAFSPDARFMVMVRNPIEMARSLHAYSVQVLMEDVEDFEMAWRLQEERAEGRSLPSVCIQADFVLYGRICRLGEQVEWLFRQVPRERVHVVVFDDLVRDPGAAYRAALDFLGVADDRRTEFDAKNVTMSHKSRLAKQVIQGLFALRQRLPVRKFGIPVIGWLVSSNLGAAGRVSMDPAFRAELVEYFRSDVDLLSRLLGRDFSGWLEPSGRLHPDAKAGRS
jgi:Sulfotransferase family